MFSPNICLSLLIDVVKQCKEATVLALDNDAGDVVLPSLLVDSFFGDGEDATYVQATRLDMRSGAVYCRQ